ncbi:hypothetical protein OPV22_016509 [Ensete ventricosum]|uniref:Uncharacterized protein n=1 Tax=Ensete ventricosum TaxID=4639 RepID=A0AAV8QVN7_ENSVE|nr:hypothetical protein OPV22_016509 [Ensete ventricosum]
MSPLTADVGHRRSLSIRTGFVHEVFNFSLRSFDRMTNGWSWMIHRWTVLWRHTLRTLLNPPMGSRNRKRLNVTGRRVCWWRAEIGDPAPVRLRPDVTRARRCPLDADADADTTSARGSEDACLGVVTTRSTRK